MAQEQQQETMFYDDDDVRITNTRFILPKQTFAMSGITSVKSIETRPSNIVPIVFLIIGVLTLLGEGPLGFAIFMFLVGGVWLALQKTTYHVLLHTASGQTKALSSYDNTYISKVVQALNNSIVHRG